MAQRPRVRGKRVVGEIAEAPPVAEEASRVRGSAPIGGHDSARESVGTTVGNRRPLRTGTRSAVGRATVRVAPTERFVGADAPVRPVQWVLDGA